MSNLNKYKVREFYDRVGIDFSQTRKRLWPEMLPYLNTLKANDTVLDIGCGNGRLIAGLPAGVKYIGIDFSKTLLEQAKKLHTDRRFIQGDVLDEKTWEKLPQAEVIFCVALIHHIPRRELAGLFGLIRKYLKPSGMVYLSAWNLWQIPYLKYHLSKKSLVTKFMDRDYRSVWVPFQEKDWRYCQAYTKADLRKQTERADLSINEVFYSQGKGWRRGKNLVLVLRK